MSQQPHHIYCRLMCVWFGDVKLLQQTSLWESHVVEKKKNKRTHWVESINYVLWIRTAPLSARPNKSIDP